MTNQTIIIGSITYAMKARKALSARGIRARLIKSEPNLENRGCAYGIEVPETSLLDTIAELRRKNIDYRIEKG